MLYTHYLLLYFSIASLLIVTIAKTVHKPKQCLRYPANDIFTATCPAFSQGPVDFSAALFPDPAVISNLGKPSSQEDFTVEPIEENSKTITSTDAKPTTIQPSNMTDKPSSEDEDKRKPLVSFEEWQKKVAQLDGDKDRRHKRKTGSTDDDSTSGNKRQQMVDSIDGGFSDDFGSMFEDLIGNVVGKKKTPNVYDEGAYISPSQSGESNKNKKDKKKQQFSDVRMKSLKERFNYASTDCAATVRKVNKEAKGAQSILYESKDQYLLNKCAADKFVIINLCEQIVVDTLVMANFEFFSSTFKDFRVYASSKYPSKEWRLLGQWQARNTRDLQVFKVPDSGFVEYMKIEFLTHYGHEYYCPLSLVRVHGMSMMEYYTTVESQDQDPVLEEEHLWPAEVREQIIQPQFDITNTSESFPIKPDLEEEDTKPIIPPIVEITPIPSIQDLEVDTEPTINDLYAQESTPDESEMVVYEIRSTSKPTISTNTVTERDIAVATSISYVKLFEENQSVLNPSSTLSETSSTSSASAPAVSSLLSPSNDSTSSSATDSTTDATLLVKLPINGTHASTSAQQTPLHPPPPKVISPNAHQKQEVNTQESIYKTIMKRLTVLEVNMTLSQRFLDDQNKILNDVFLDMEKRHQDQLILLIGHLNETASYKIDSMKRRYEQWYEDLKDQTESDMREMTSKVSILADQLSFERRVSVSQLLIMITLFVFMALSRGTFSTLSPVMAAQQEERKRRESIDQSSAVVKEALDVSLENDSNNRKNIPGSLTNNNNTTASAANTTYTAGSAGTAINPTILHTNSTPAEASTSSTNSAENVSEDVVSVIAQKLNETPKKPNNPRRHSDSPYHIMGNTFSTNESYESLGIELQNDVLQKRLGDILMQQQKEQEVPSSSSKNDIKVEDCFNRENDITTIVRNRKRSSTSPSLQ